MAGRKRAEGKSRSSRLDIRAVATHAKVSVSTVSRVMNENSKVDPELTRRVREAVKQLGYIPNRQASALVSGRSGIFGVLISDITNPFFPELIQGFEDAAVEQGYETIIGSTNYDAAKMDVCIDRLLQRNVEGVAVMTFGIEQPLLDRLASHGIPMVFIDVAPRTDKSVAISIDYAKGIHEGVQHLAVLGHRRIAFISGPPDLQSAIARRKAFLSGMRDIGITPPPEYLVTGDHTLQRGTEACEQLLQLPAPPTAIMCSNDLTAIGAMHAISDARLKVPEDISVIGFDDVRFSAYIIPPMTTIRMSRTEIARAAVKTLVGLLAGAPVSEPARITTQLVVRQSTSLPNGSLRDLETNKPS